MPLEAISPVPFGGATLGLVKFAFSNGEHRTGLLRRIRPGKEKPPRSHKVNSGVVVKGA